MSLHRTYRARTARPRLWSLESRDVPSVWIVDDTPNKKANFTTIQAAVDAASPGDTILVEPGTYKEQVTIGPTKNGLKLEGVADHKAVIQPPATFKGDHALIAVDGATGVLIDGFTVTGPSADLDFGVLVEHKGSATIRDNVISDIRSDPLGGDQTGIGVWVDTGATATVVKNDIVRYQKGGIVALDDGTKLIAAGNTIKGAGPTGVIAQNGIQVAVGANAIITGNKISGNVFTGTGADASGVIAFQAGRVVVAGNKLTGNEIGVIGQEQTSPLFVTGNDIRGSTLDGIGLGTVDKAVISGNDIRGSGRDGIRLEDTTGTRLFDNRSKGNAADGLTVTGASKDNVVFMNVFVGNGKFDVSDDTTGTGTAGTANTYFGNRIRTASPSALATPGKGHGHHGDNDHQGDDDGGDED
jgi:parallel beta-helix repeat protein